MCIISPYLPFNTNSHLAGRWKQVSTQSQISSRHGGLYLTQDLPVKTKNNTQTLQHVNNCTSTKEEDERDYCHFRHLIILYLCVFTDVFVSNYNKAHESWSLSQKQRLSERNSFVFHSRAFWFQTCLFPTHHWNSLPKANISRKHRVHGDIRNTLHFQEETSDSGGKKKKRLGAGRSVRPKWGSVLLLDFLSFLQSWPLQTWFIRRAACEHTHLWAACKTDSCKGSISVWWFYLSVFPLGQNTRGKKCEMRSHVRHGSLICCMRWLDIVSLLYSRRLILATSLYRNTKLHLLLRCVVSRFQPQTHFQDFSFV